ncbi:MAG: trehalose-phosphatase [Patulibacter minatonensis]
MADAPAPGATEAAALTAALAPILAHGPRALALLLDFDGVLSPIVDDPAAARPDPTAAAALFELAPRIALAACVTGRPALQARELLGLDELTYSGLHGAELLLPGAAEPIVPEAFAADAGLVAGIVDEAEEEAAGLAGLAVERKGPIIALHWRRAADPVAAEARAQELAERARARGLRTGTGRAVLELRPGLEVTKGDAVRALLGRTPEACTALVAGDDVTDLNAFAAARELALEGPLAAALLVAVAGDDAPPAVAAGGDVVVESPAALGALLEQLARRVSAEA